MKRLRRYRWPGDVGELQSLIERAVTSARQPKLEIDEALLDEGLPLGLYRLMEKLGEGGWVRCGAPAPVAGASLRGQADSTGTSGREQSGGGDRTFPSGSADIARLTSPNTVRLYDFGVSETGSFYFVMELLGGVDLTALVQRFGPLPPERVVDVLRQAVALSARPMPRDSFTATSSRRTCTSAASASMSTSSRSSTSASSSHSTKTETQLTAAGTLTGTPGVHAARTCRGRGGGRAFRPLLAWLRGLLDADRPAIVHRGADGRHDPSCADRAQAAVDDCPDSHSRSARADRPGLSRKSAGQAPIVGARAVAPAG